MNKSQTLTLILISFVFCSSFFIETANVKAAGVFTNYYVGFMQTDLKVAMPNNLIIFAMDASNNTVNSYNGSFTLTCSDPKAILPTSPQLTLTNGGGSYSVYFGTAGTQTITVTDVSNNAVFTTLTVTVAPIHFGISVNPTNITAGESVNVTVTALDVSDTVLSTIGNQGYGASIEFSSTDSQAQFPPTGSTSNLINGIGVFNITLQTPGSQTITATNKNFKLVNATTNPITVNTLPTPTPSSTPTQTPIVSPTPTVSVSPSATQTPAPTAPATTQGQTAGNSQTEVIVAVVVAVILIVVVVFVFMKRQKSKNNLPPTSPSSPS